MGNYGKAGLPVLRVAAALLALLSCAHTAIAAPKAGDDATQRVLKKAQGVIRQLTEEKAALATEKATLEAKVAELEQTVRKLEPLEAEVERYKAGLEETRSKLGSQLSQGLERERALQEKHREVIAKAREIRSDNGLLVQAVREREQWIEQCTEHNRNLGEAGREILEKYRDKGFWEELAELEPVTGIGKVRTGDVVEEYRYKLQHLKATPFRTETSPPPAETSVTIEEN